MKYIYLICLLINASLLFGQQKIELISPKDGAVCSSNMPTLAWSSLACDGYELWIDGIKMAIVPPKNTSFQVFPLSYGKHEWTLVAIHAKTEAKSDVHHFTIEGKPLGRMPENALLLRQSWAVVSSAIVKDGGDKLSSLSINTDKWAKTSIPATALTALVRNGLYPDPYVGLNNLKIPDCNDDFNKQYDLLKYSHIPGQNPWAKPYWYRTEFEMPKSFQGKMIWLTFNEINYRAELWLNGTRIADTAVMVGMDRSFRFEVTKYIKQDARNVLAVAIYPPDHAGLPAPEPITPLADPGDNMADGLISHDYTKWDVMGWDWQPSIRDRDMGITEDVFLSTTDAVEIQDLYVSSNMALPDTSVADVCISANLVNHSSMSKQGTVSAVITSGSQNIQFELPFALQANETKTVLWDAKSVAALHISKPKLWWPVGYGAPNLYQLKLVAKANTGEQAVASTSFGIRKVETYMGKKERVYKINGKDIYCRGGNWVIDMMLNWTAQRYEDEIQLTQGANLNLLRIWGPTGAPPESFYDTADRMGVMLWQDFLNDFWGTFKNREGFQPNVSLFEKATAEIVKKYRNHPSLVIWCGGNEGINPREKLITEKILPTYDGRDSRHYLHASNADGLHGGGPYHTLEPEEYFKHKQLNGFSSEIGPSGVPVLESMQRFLPELGTDFLKERFPLTGDWAYHDATDRNDTRKFSSYDDLVRKYYGDTKSTDENAVEQYVNRCQLVNYDCYRASFESINRQLWKNSSGILLWKSNSSWPSLTWQIYDWYLQAHAGYYGSKKACEQLHIQVNRDDRSISVLNANLYAADGVKINAVLYDQSLNPIWKQEKTTSLQANANTNLGWVVPASLKLNFLKLSIQSKNGELLSDNFYWLKDSNDYSDLMSLPAAKLSGKLQVKKTANGCIYELLLSNTGSFLAFMTALSLKSKASGLEVLPSFWSDNYITLLPGETRKLSVEVSDEQSKEVLGISCKSLNMKNAIWFEP